MARLILVRHAWALDFESLEPTHVYDAGTAPPDA